MAALALLLPTVVCLVVFGAHLIRSGMPLMVLLVPFVLCLLFIPRGWVARLFQLLLALMAVEWVHTAVSVALERRAAGEPWLRAIAILVGMALLNLAAAWLFEQPPLRDVYPRD
jgi:hypothetical protein